MQYDLAQHYFSSEAYFLAIAEYRRFIHFFPEDNRVKQAWYQLGMSYFNMGQYTDALGAFQNITRKYQTTEVPIQSHFMISKCYMKMGEMDRAIATLRNLFNLTEDINVIDQVNYEIGWYYLEGPWFESTFEKARQYFLSISRQNREKYELDNIIARLEQARPGDKGGIPQKNPTAAGLLSVIPGAGFLYCERYQDAFIAFLLNSGLILAAYEAFDNGNEALGGVITFFEFGFYAGNIYGAMGSAHKYNKTKIRQFIEKLNKDRHINFSVGLSENGGMFCLKYSF